MIDDGPQLGPGGNQCRSVGRPKGSITLTDEIAQTIISYIRSGAWDYIAAEAAGISARTFRDWIARGEGRGPRSATRRLREFAVEVRTARAQARLAAEVKVFRDQPAYWLVHAARTKSDREGWTEEARETSGEQERHPNRSSTKFTDEELRTASQRLHEAAADLLAERGCSTPTCQCELHETRRRNR